MLALTVVLCLLTAAGCVQADLACGVTEDCRAYIRIDMQADLSGTDADRAQEMRAGLRLLASYYRSELGYDVQENLDGGNRSCAGADDADPPGGQPRGRPRSRSSKKC